MDNEFYPVGVFEDILYMSVMFPTGYNFWVFPTGYMILAFPTGYNGFWLQDINVLYRTNTYIHLGYPQDINYILWGAT